MFKSKKSTAANSAKAPRTMKEKSPLDLRIAEH